jgi:hypothetical protein
MSETVCAVCSNPLTGKQKIYCSHKCKNVKQTSKRLTLTQGKKLILDSLSLGNEAFDLASTDNNLVGLNKFNWYINSKGYAQSCATLGSCKLHHIIWEFFNGSIPNGYIIDHENRNKLDNKLSNLRLATAKQNSYNKKATHNKKASKYKGVHKTASGKYQSQIWVNGKNRALGSYETEEEAATVYNQYAKQIQGIFAYQNTLAAETK